MKLLKLVTIEIVLNGWVIPLFVSLSMIISFLTLKVSPIIYENEKPLNSFPFMQVADTSAIIFIVWSLASLAIKVLLKTRSS